MKKLYSLKRFLAGAVAVATTIGISGNGLYYTKAGADDNSAEMQTTAVSQRQTQTEAVTQQDVPANNGQAQNDDSGSNDTSSTVNTGEYAKKLREIAEQQAELDKELTKAEKDLKDQTKKNKALKKKIDSVNEEINVLNGYMTALEIQISSNQRKLDETKEDIKEGVEGFKKRLRAMYLAGSDSYTTVILESDSFFDVLMRLELIKRVADHDNSIISRLVNLQNIYERTKKDLDSQQKEYQDKADELSKKKKALDKLYDTNEDTRQQLARKKKALEAQNKSYEAQMESYGAGLAGLLKSSTGNTPQDQQVKATMLLADKKIAELKKAIKARKKAGKKIGKYECQYTFAWPVPQSYDITYGIGARWGAYHAGIDIGGEHGYKVCASESGKVLRVNTICPHDYGKSGSCGCGGGYGKYVIIDHGNEFITLYGHLSEVDVLPGDKVKEGELIGKMGSTGFSTGDHTHFEIRYQGYILNPAFYVDVK